MFSTEKTNEIIKDTYKKFLNVDDYTIEPILDEPVERTNTVIWFKLFGIKLTRSVNVTFYPKIIRWQIGDEKFSMKVYPFIEKDEFESGQVIYSENENETMKFVKHKITPQNMNYSRFMGSINWIKENEARMGLYNVR